MKKIIGMIMLAILFLIALVNMSWSQQSQGKRGEAIVADETENSKPETDLKLHGSSENIRLGFSLLNPKKNSEENQNTWLSGQISKFKINRSSDSASAPYETSFPATISGSLTNTQEYNTSGNLRNDDPIYNKKSPIWVPILEVLGQDLLLNLVDHYILHYDFAVVGFSSWNRTFVHSGWPWNSGWKWDTDRFGNNFLLHPYTGAGYFNLARASGYNYWVSSAFVFGGAYMWKLFGENGGPEGKPEREDLIITTLGGIFLGETLYRIGSNVIDESSTGFERVGRELLALMICPGRSISRLLSGKLFRHVTQAVYQTEPLNTTFSFGYHSVNSSPELLTGSNSVFLNFIFDYGDPFEIRSRKPFDYFRLRADLDFGVGRKMVDNIGGYGLLFGGHAQTGHLEMLVGLFQHMNYFDNRSFEIGTFSFGPGIISRLLLGKSSSFANNLHVGLVPFGGLSRRFGPENTEARDYYFVGGAEGKLESFLDIGRWAHLTFIGYYWWLHTWVGDLGNSYIGLIKPRIVLELFKNVGVGYEHLVYYGDRYPLGFPSVHSVRTEDKYFVQFFIRDERYSRHDAP